MKWTNKQRREHLIRAQATRTQKLRETFVARFWDRVDKKGPNGCWLWKGTLSEDGYGRVKKTGERLVCHRLTFGWRFGEPPKHLQVCHHCDVPRCVNPDHLFLGTAQDNIDDCIKKNRRRYYQGEREWLKGERNPKAKLTEAIVRMIRSTDFSKLGSKTIMARELGISAPLISSIIRRKIWKNVI